MAKNSTSTATIEVTTNAQKAKNDIEEINNLLKRLQKTKQLMMKEGLAFDKDGKETATFKKLNQDINEATKALKDNTNAQEKMKATLNDLSNLRLKDLKRRYRELSKELGNFTGQEKAAAQQWRNNLDKIKAKIVEIEGAGTAASKSMIGFGSSLKTTLKNLVAYAGVFAVFNKIKSTLTDLYKKNIQLSDELTNVRKVSQLAEEDINRMAVAIAKIDTRTSVHELNNLAYAGAKLGMGQYGAEGLVQFVKAADKVNVALKEDLGEDALTAMSKLVEVMGLIPKMGIEKSMDAAGSAIFMLSTSSTATGANIIEMSKRLMGLANVSHVATDELLALSSASDAMGLMPEVSATAFNKVFTSIQTNTRGIAKALGDTQGELQALIDQGKTMEGIVFVLEKMHNMSMQEMKGRGLFKALGSDGARLNNVIATMANRIDMLKDHLDISTEAFEEATAVQKEYEMQMESAAGYMDRARNVWEKAFVNPEGVDYTKQIAVEWYNLSKEITRSAPIMEQIKLDFNLIGIAIKEILKALPDLITLLFFYGVGRILQGIWLQFKSIKMAIDDTAVAQGRLNALMKANAFAIAVAGAGWLITKYITLKNAAKEAAKTQEEVNKAIYEAESAYKKDKEKLDDYLKRLNDTSRTEEERNKIIRKFNREFNTYINKLGVEIKTVDDLKGSYEDLNREIRKRHYYLAGEKLQESYVGQAQQEEADAFTQLQNAAQKYGFDANDVIKQLKDKVVQVNGTLVTSMDYLPSEEEFNQLTSNYTYRNILSDEDINPVIRMVYNQMYGAKYGKKNAKTGEYELPWTTSTGLEYKAGENNTRSAFPLGEKAGHSIIAGNSQTAEIYHAILDYGKAVTEVRNREKKFKDYLNEFVGDDYVLPDMFGDDYDDYDGGATKDEIKEEKERLRKELKDAKEQADAVISKIEEWYRLQETVITDMQADGKLTKEQTEQAVRTLNIVKNTALRDARLAISGRDTKAWETTKKDIGNLMLDQGEWSTELLQQILDVSMESIRENLANIDAGGGQYGITSTSLKDAVDKNAAGNQREIAKLRAQSQQEVEKILLEYHYVETAIKGFSNRLAQMGILTETAQQMSERLSDANNADKLFSMKDYNELLRGNELAKKSMLQAFLNSGNKKYGVNPEDKEQLREWFMEFVGEYANDSDATGGVSYQYKSWAKPFEKDFELWLEKTSDYLPQIQAFYFSLIKTEDDYYDAMKKAYQKQKTLFSQRWEYSGRSEYYDNLQKQLNLRNRQLSLTGKDKGTNLVDLAGFDEVNEDPEIAMSIARMQQAKEELELFKKTVEQKKMAGEELAAFQKNLREKEIAATEAEMSLQEQLMKSINDRISKLQEWTAPIETFGTEVGQALYDQWHNGESMTAKWQDMLKKMGLAWGQLTIKIVSELMMQRIKQNIIDKAMQADAIKHQATMRTIEQTGGQARQLVQQTTDQALIQGNQVTNTIIETQQQAHNATTLSEDVGQAAAENPVNTSRAAGKTLAGLGWWGIPLVAVVTALLNALLQAALGSSSKKTNSNSSTSNSNEATKIKLVSGMLTYDKGNVGTYAGTDGHVYRAASSPAPGTGLITRPIATTVQGNPALVAERGPEIVIGRRATANIMRWNPALLNVLASYDPYSRRRTYDEGTPVPAAVPSASPDGQTDPRMEATLASLAQTVALLSATVSDLQKKGIPAHINKYGTGGLIDEVKSGLRFDARYSG